VRPEDVALATERAALSDPVLGAGEVVEASFSGADERLRLRLPALPGVRAIHPPAPFGDEHLAVDVSRPQHVSRREPLRAGDRVWVGVRRLHALVHPGLSFVAVGEGGPAVDAATELARLAQARLDRVAALRDVPARLEREPVDLVVAPLAGPHPATQAEEVLAQAGAAHVLLVRGSVPMPPQRFLVAVAVGEPGKDDVDFVGRLARHLGSPATVLTVLAPDADPAEGAAAERFLAGCVRTLARWGVGAEPEAVRGALAAEVGARLAGGRHDLLVLGEPLADALGRPHWGRAARQILEAPADAPILVVRSALRQSPTQPVRGGLP
jgi:sulfate transport system ATP-binding protein